MSTSRVLGSGVFLLTLLACASCGSDKDDAAENTAPATSADTAATRGAAKSPAAAEGPGAWRDYPSAPSKPAYPFNRAFALPPPAPAPDPDATIARYTKECAGGAKTPECRALKADVEEVFLEALLAVRAGTEPVDPEWYRVAAAADTPQLACVGINELVYLSGRTAQDDALIVNALDHPAPSVRAASESR